MKIGILTQPLHNNYGGILQAYALQKVLKDMGHEVWTVDSQFEKKSFLTFLIILFKRFVLKYILNRKDIKTLIPIKPNTSEKEFISQHLTLFIKENINTTEETTLNNLEKLVEEYQFKAMVVGSDQVWRPKYSPKLDAYFLKPLTMQNIKRIAYAASFGTDCWEFSKSQTKQYSELLKIFDLITVREDSAVKLCNEKFKAPATRVLDPTLLLTKENYIKLISNNISDKSKDYILIYALDASRVLESRIKKIFNELNCEIKIIEPEKPLDSDFRENLNDYILPPVELWVHDFFNAKYVITDSFHGSVFSILFHKPFLSLGNVKRGLSRFESLLNLLKLENRLILNANEITEEKITEPINFEYVDDIINTERAKAINMLSLILN